MGNWRPPKKCTKLGKITEKIFQNTCKQSFWNPCFLSCKVTDPQLNVIENVDVAVGTAAVRREGGGDTG